MADLDGLRHRLEQHTGRIHQAKALHWKVNHEERECCFLVPAKSTGVKNSNGVVDRADRDALSTHNDLDGEDIHFNNIKCDGARYQQSLTEGI